MRKSLIAAAASVAALAGATVAHAQTPSPAPQPTLEASISPENAGTRGRPARSRLNLEIGNPAESRSTVSRIVVSLPRDSRVDTRGFPVCPQGQLARQGTKACPRGSRVGRGTAEAILVAQGTNIDFRVTAFVGGRNLLLFYVEQQGGSVRRVLPGRVSRMGGAFGQRISIDIAPDLQQPAPGLFSALTQLNAEISGRRGRRSLIATTGCPEDGGHDLRVRLFYVPNPAPPQVPFAEANDESRCSD